MVRSQTPTAGMPYAVAHAVGCYGERLAARYLRERGMVILERNWRCPSGEIDIVARDGACLVVCEVKTRRGGSFGSPVEGVTLQKLARLRRLAGAWLEDRGTAGPAELRPATGLPDVRVDVVGVRCPRSGPCEIEHLVGVG